MFLLYFVQRSNQIFSFIETVLFQIVILTVQFGANLSFTHVHFNLKIIVDPQTQKKNVICHSGLKIEVFPIVITPTSGNNLFYTFDSAPPEDKYRTAVSAFHEFSSKNDTGFEERIFLLLY